MPTHRTRIAPARSSNNLKAYRRQILRIAERYGVTNVRVFGSFARGENRKGSDLDLLVRFPPHASLFDVAGMKVDLEEAIHRKVDVVPDDSIKPALRSRILSEARPL